MNLDNPQYGYDDFQQYQQFIAEQRRELEKRAEREGGRAAEELRFAQGLPVSSAFFRDL